MERPVFPPAEGTVPASMNGLKQVSELSFKTDAQLGSSKLPGKGTLEDPYVVSGYAVTGTFTLQDTDACVVVTGNYIDGQLALNWNGQCLHVHHNFVRDLRVNENIKRSGVATGGLMEMNKIAYIGQLRHYDGEFRDNVVGPHTTEDVFDEVLETVPFNLFGPDPRAANIDGFNQGAIHHNTFHGSVDLDFHGHHHGTGFFATHSHYHGSSGAKMHTGENHTDRWTSVSFTDNVIDDPDGYGLRYEDQDHAGDDRTAESEQTKALDQKHTHHTDVVIARNTIKGGKLWVDVFDAADTNHLATEGNLLLEDNTVEFTEQVPKDSSCLLFSGTTHDPHSAIQVDTAEHATLTLRRNHVTYVTVQPGFMEDPLGFTHKTLGDACPFQPEGAQAPTGILLHVVRSGTVLLEDNTVKGATHAVEAQKFGSVKWTVRGLATDAEKPVWTDGSPDAPSS